MFLRILFLLLISGWAWGQDAPSSNKTFVVIETTPSYPSYTLKKMADERPPLYEVEKNP